MALVKACRGFEPQIGPDCFLAENATVVGDVQMGEQCSVWFSAVVRGDVNSIRMGNKVNIQDGAVLHCTYEKNATIIGNNVSIGHNAMIHGCTIKSNVLVGMGAIIMDDCVVGENSIIAAGAVLYLEGYLYDQPEAKVAFRAAAEIAHQHNRQVSLTLSDSFCVDRHRDDFRALISDEIDILFGNEAELLALYETDTFEFAVTQLRQDCIVAAITRSEHGSVVVTKDGVIEVPAQPVAQVVDTTGAGDLYAAGFLYGYTRGMDLKTCATLGHIASAEVISHVGPRPQIALSSLLPAS